MQIINRLAKTLLILPFVLLIFAETTSAQRVLRYQGEYSIGDFSGEAIFDYGLIKEDTVFEGTFKFKENNIGLNFNESVRHLNMEGKMADNSPEGKWKLTFSNFSTDKKIERVNYTYQLKLSGTEHKLEGEFSKGLPNGQWEQVVRNIDDAEIADTLFYSQYDFRKGVPQKSFEIKDNNNMLAGRFVRAGFAHDSWELYTLQSLEAEEIWFFEEGRLEKINNVSNDSSWQTLIYPIEMSNPKTMVLDSSYLAIIHLLQKLSSNNKQDAYSGISALLTKNEAYFNKGQSVLNKIGEATLHTNVQVKVEQYSLQENEIANLDSLATDYAKSAAVSKDLKNNTQINILKLANEQVLFEVTALNFYENMFFRPLNQIINAYRKGLLDYVPVKKLAANLLPVDSLFADHKIAFNWNDSLKSRNISDIINIGTTTSSGFNLLTDYAHEVLNNIKMLQASLNQRLETEQRQQQLLQLEETLMRQLNVLNHKIDSLKPAISSRAAEVLTTFQGNIKKKLSAYSRMGEDFEKPAEAKMLIQCFKESEDLMYQVATLPEKKKEIKALYTDDVFNPFTSTVMSEQVKSRLTDAYSEVLIPYFLDRLKQPLECQKVLAYSQALAALHQKMRDLRNTDTDLLERKLKKEENPSAILNLLGINIASETITP